MTDQAHRTEWPEEWIDAVLKFFGAHLDEFDAKCVLSCLAKAGALRAQSHEPVGDAFVEVEHRDGPSHFECAKCGQRLSSRTPAVPPTDSELEEIEKRHADDEASGRACWGDKYRPTRERRDRATLLRRLKASTSATTDDYIDSLHDDAMATKAAKASASATIPTDFKTEQAYRDGAEAMRAACLKVVEETCEVYEGDGVIEKRIRAIPVKPL